MLQNKHVSSKRDVTIHSLMPPQFDRENGWGNIMFSDLCTQQMNACVKI